MEKKYVGSTALQAAFTAIKQALQKKQDKLTGATKEYVDNAIQTAIDHSWEASY